LTNGSGVTITHKYNYPGEYIVELMVTDNHGAVDNDSTTANIYSSRPLPRPTIEGQRFGKLKVEYNFTFSSVNPDGDHLLYYIDWGDDSNTGWIGPYPSGAEVIVNNTWEKIGLYNIQAKVKTIFNYESDWAQYYIFIFITRNTKEYVGDGCLFGRFPMLERLLYLMI
jgi:hypothetical protein